MSRRIFAAAIIAGTLNVAAAPFQNLDFEQANTNRVSYDPQTGRTSGPIEDLLPGWQIRASSAAFGTTNFLTELAFNSDSSIALNDHDFTDAAVLRSGKYSLGISSPLFGDYTLIQSGEVPAGAIGLTFSGVVTGPMPPSILVTMNGVQLEPNFSAGGLELDVSPFSGQNVELRITFPAGSYYDRTDSILFVPEPSSLLLMACAVPMLLLCCRTIGWRERRVSASVPSGYPCRVPQPYRYAY